MSWILLAQVLILMLASGVMTEAIIGSTIDKRREDAIKRKEAGL
jgi:hypothetical protein